MKHRLKSFSITSSITSAIKTSVFNSRGNSSNKMWVEERKRQKELGCLADMKTYSIANAQIRKMLNCKHQICG